MDNILTLSSLPLWLAIFATGLVILCRFRRISVVHLSFVGMVAYSIPSLIGVTYVPETRSLEPVSIEALDVMATAWLSLGASFFFGSFIYPVSQKPVVLSSTRQLSLFSGACILVYLMAYSLVALNTSWIFFLEGRLDARLTSFEATIGSFVLKWSAAILLLSALQDRQHFISIIAIAFLVVIAISGDRTTPVIAACAAALIFLSHSKFSEAALSLKLWLLFSALLFAIFFTKPAYISISTGHDFFDVIRSQSPLSFILQWEAFVIHEILERVIRYNFTYEFSSIASGILGQLLIVPSAFGIVSGQFNVAFQQELFPDVEYGMAYNYWAQLYSVGGYLGVAFGASILAGCIMVADKIHKVARPPAVLLAVLLGAVIAVYAHRNSAENLVAMVRQVVITFIPIYLIYAFLRLGKGKMHPTIGTAAN